MQLGAAVPSKLTPSRHVPIVSTTPDPSPRVFVHDVPEHRPPCSMHIRRLEKSWQGTLHVPLPAISCSTLPRTWALRSMTVPSVLVIVATYRPVVVEHGRATKYTDARAALSKVPRRTPVTVA